MADVLLVAPHTGAWIETPFHLLVSRLTAVAPHTGAWIETSRRSSVADVLLSSRPTRARGLKRVRPIRKRVCIGRAPHGRVD